MATTVTSFSDRVEIGTSALSPALILRNTGEVSLGSSPAVDANSPTDRLVSMQDVVTYVQQNTTANSTLVTPTAGSYSVNISFGSGLYFDAYRFTYPRRITLIYDRLIVSGTGASLGLVTSSASGAVVNLGVTGATTWPTNGGRAPFTIASTATLRMSGTIQLELVTPNDTTDELRYTLTGHSARVDSASGRLDISTGNFILGIYRNTDGTSYITLTPGTTTSHTFSGTGTIQMLWEV